MTGPGAVVCFRNPPSTDKFLGEGSTPILTSARPLVILHDNFVLPERPIAPNGTDVTGCILNGARVEPQSMETFQTGCDGRLCDQKNLLVNGILMKRCPCMQMDKSGKVMHSWILTVIGSDGNSFTVRFSSKWFMFNFILSAPFPIGTKASDFEPYLVEERLFGAFRSVCDYINNHGGFRIFLWVKRGQVQDQGVDQPNDGLPYNAARSTVESGILNHHIVRMEPMTPTAIDGEALNNLKFNVSTGFRNEEG